MPPPLLFLPTGTYTLSKDRLLFINFKDPPSLFETLGPGLCWFYLITGEKQNFTKSNVLSARDFRFNDLCGFAVRWFGLPPTPRNREREKKISAPQSKSSGGCRIFENAGLVSIAFILSSIFRASQIEKLWKWTFFLRYACGRCVLKLNTCVRQTYQQQK